MNEDRFGAFVFSNISNNQSFGEQHGGHLCAGGGGGLSRLEDHFQAKL